MDMREKVARELYRWGWQEMAILEDWERAEREHKEDSIQEAAAILAMVEGERIEYKRVNDLLMTRTNVFDKDAVVEAERKRGDYFEARCAKLEEALDSIKSYVEGYQNFASDDAVVKYIETALATVKED